MFWLTGIIKSPGRNRWPDAELARALGPLARRVLARYWLESARLALIWGLALAGLAQALLWVRPVLSPSFAALAGGLAALIAVAIRVYRRPDALAAVRVADLMGLDGSAVTAFRLLESGAEDPWSLAAAAGGLAACRGISPVLLRGYPVLPKWRSWTGVLLLAGVLAVNQLVPNPLTPYWEAAREQEEVLAAAALKARQALAGVEGLKIRDEYVLPDGVREKIGDLPREIERSGSRRDAANRLERAHWQLDEARAVVGDHAQQDLGRLAAAWGAMPGEEWQKLAGAMQRGSPEEIWRSAQDLTAAIEKAGPEERKKTAAALLGGSGAVRDSSLRRALREAAGAALGGGQAAGSPAGSGRSGQEGPNLAAPAGDLAGALAGLSEAAGAASALGTASSGLAALAGSLAGSLAGAGSSGELKLAGNSGNSGEASPGAGAEGGGNSGSGNSGNSGNSGSGGSQSSGTGQGGQGSGGSGAGRSGGGLNLVYTPFLPDGGGRDSLAPGELRRGDPGSEVELNSSPTTLGEVLPDSLVYGRYLAETHDSLSRAPLPPDLESLVWRYFSGLESERPEN